VISLLDLGVQRLREAMTFGAPETEALDEGNAQKGFGFLSLDGSPVPLGSTATNETTGVSKTLWRRWKSPNATGLKTLWIKRQSNTKQINVSDNQQPSGDKQIRMLLECGYVQSHVVIDRMIYHRIKRGIGVCY
jgi:hypothetical protein